MPPKRKAAAAKVVKEEPAAENGAGGDVATTKKGKAKEVEELPKEIKTRKTRAAKPVVDGSEDEEKPKETKTKGRKAKGTTQPEVPAVVEEEEPKPKRGRAAAKMKDEQEEEVEEEKPKKEAKKPKKKGTKETKSKEDAKPKRGRAAKAEAKEESDEEEDPPIDEGTDLKSKKVRGKGESEAAPQNQTSSDYTDVDFSCSKVNANGEKANFKISSWNVGGLRAWLKKRGTDYITKEDPDVMCLQEIKCSEDKLPDEITSIKGYKCYFCESAKEGYAGVAVFSKLEPLSIDYGIGNTEHDEEGRCITVEYEKFYLVNVYVPNAGRKLITLPKRLEWNALFKDYIKSLDEKKPVIICGDMNVAHNEIDLTNPKTNTRNAGFTKEERDGMTEFLEEGYVDTYRELYPDKTNVYTFWSYFKQARAKNIGWRLDYFIISERFWAHICDNVVRSEVFGSDHCPITLFLNV